jgi:tetratricopeptide (TPR) repeat protein
VLFWQRGEFEKAIEQLHLAIQSQPGYAEAHYTLGTVLKQEGKLSEAAASLREAIRLQPDFAGAHSTLAGVLRQLGDSPGATEEARAASQLTTVNNSLQAATFATNSGKRLLSAGDVEGAIAQFRAAIKMADQYSPAHYQLAQALRQQGNTQEAARELDRATEIDSRPR